MNNKNDDLDDILDALSVSNIPESPKKIKSPDQSIECDLKSELKDTLKELNELIKMNSSVLEEAKRLVESTGDAEYLDAYSSVGKSQSEAFKNKVKILTDLENINLIRDTKNREIAIKEKLADHTIGKSEIAASVGTLNQTNNVIMSSSREEMFEMILKMKDKELITIDIPSII